jgi:hypothetical protein
MASGGGRGQSKARLLLLHVHLLQLGVHLQHLVRRRLRREGRGGNVSLGRCRRSVRKRELAALTCSVTRPFGVAGGGRGREREEREGEQRRDIERGGERHTARERQRDKGTDRQREGRGGERRT